MKDDVSAVVEDVLDAGQDEPVTETLKLFGNRYTVTVEVVDPGKLLGIFPRTPKMAVEMLANDELVAETEVEMTHGMESAEGIAGTIRQIVSMSHDRYVTGGAFNKPPYQDPLSPRRPFLGGGE
jgi:hypothetical protein